MMPEKYIDAVIAIAEREREYDTLNTTIKAVQVAKDSIEALSANNDIKRVLRSLQALNYYRGK